MSKHGSMFLSIVSPEQRVRGVWEPYLYRSSQNQSLLGDYVTATKPSRKRPPCKVVRSLEYRGIPSGSSLTFDSGVMSDTEISGPLVTEGTLLFGTMRAYLGNVVVTPKDDWFDRNVVTAYNLRSEFLVINPLDDCYYFWLLYFRSKSFLAQLPTGAGGTRPRLSEEVLCLTPVAVPPIEDRQEIHREVERNAEAGWKIHAHVEHLLKRIVNG